MTLSRVAVVVPPRPALFELGVVHEVFGVDRTDDGVPAIDLVACTEVPGVPLPTSHGITMTFAHGLEAAADADLVVAPAYDTHEPPSKAVLEVFRAAHARGAWVLSVCSGAFLLGHAGLLDGRRSTTHWRHAAELAERFPATVVDPDVLFVEDDRVITSAGTAAGIDACLHHVRCELGAGVANRIARRMVVPPQRDGGQRQFIDLPVPDCRAESLSPLLTWMREHLAEDLPVRTLARRAAMSERTFARRFVAETGTTPARWLLGQRLHHARSLLEATDLPVEAVASRAGFGSAALLRHHFGTRVGVSPAEYRRTFSAPAPVRAAG
ncbi:helix-turn-helix domain-containing protein [Nocardioides aurantiacus]|uniref:AraC family transcriptional regulator with amidase-like domain n=1 Tax=Nocardioides aurantiacus TaxID=86796 RepID=A0A3N2CQM8_9ACTN|nr:helix-turn-helix domain-containing protein [Nocardioides aurantiacus]ROR89833.1 AraC family transcriptional regulator with amidase-like domain [Nocardioides aurantiacus]